MNGIEHVSRVIPNGFLGSQRLALQLLEQIGSLSEVATCLPCAEAISERRAG